ncbi:hypothetical protein MalM25_10410 [Planctomycetes bacterium MalM25]|nr:hypothetical protein MalM25_10410 [Planctomycetes bacterium MalM25]
MLTPSRVLSLTLLVAAIVLAPTLFAWAAAPEEASPGVAALAELKSFSAAYEYDTEYLETLLAEAPGAFWAFEGAQGASSFRQAAPLDAHYVARIATMQVEDCGPCTQLNLRMAIEAGVERSLLDNLLHAPEKLPQPLQDVRDHARAVAGAEELDPARVQRLRAHYGDEAFSELAVVITGSRLYPTLKRALMKNERCLIGDLDY